MDDAPYQWTSLIFQRRAFAGLLLTSRIAGPDAGPDRVGAVPVDEFDFRGEGSGWGLGGGGK